MPLALQPLSASTETLTALAELEAGRILHFLYPGAFPAAPPSQSSYPGLWSTESGGLRIDPLGGDTQNLTALVED